mgnify:CR=1 FL=1
MAELEKPIRVLYVSPWAHWRGHPADTAIKEIAALVKAGAQVSLCTFRDILGQKGLKQYPTEQWFQAGLAPL